jgi:diadenosine tetraphosphate (Ap4A) HIT family hydrolase
LKNEKIFAEYPGKDNLPLVELCRELFVAQKKSWPALASAYRDLALVNTRELSCGNYKVVLQHNPRRAESSGAAVDARAIKKRPCFLCTKHLPPQQQGILYRQDYLILCNPAPIFEGHFTVVSIRHQKQKIASSLSSFLQMAADLAPEYTIFYNGPACGASAPDHLHFQMIPSNALPFLEAFRARPSSGENSSVRFYQENDIDRSVIILGSKNAQAIRYQFTLLTKAMHKILSTNNEPLMNVLCSSGNDGWRLIIFLRQKHRPEAYFAEGQGRIFVSPGAIDMAGVIITPLGKDYDRLDCDGIRGIYREVSLSQETLRRIVTLMP